MQTIHKTAIIADGADIHESVDIGPYAVIGANVKIGRGTKIGPHAVLDGHTTIGEDCNIFAGVAIGMAPQDLGYKDEPTKVVIGNRNTLREYVTVHRGTGEGTTRIGNDCFLMNYAHVAHDCTIGNGVILANGTTMGGHVHIDDGAVLAGVVVIHQWCRLGKMLMVSGLAATRQDLPPFAMCDGRPMTVRGINSIGLRRKKVSPAARSAIKETYRIIYRSALNLTNALEKVSNEIEPFEEIQEIIGFFKSSKRGVVGWTVSEGAELDGGE